MNKENILFITEKLNNTNARWGIGGSLLLKLHGIIDVVNDLDLIVHSDDVPMLVQALAEIGQERKVESLEPFRTTHYFEFKVKNIGIDVMGDFKIIHEEGMYHLPFNEQSLEFHADNGVDFPFCLLEDWYILYLLMPGRDYKVTLIEKYFSEKGIPNRSALELHVKKGNLPERIKSRVSNLLMVVD